MSITERNQLNFIILKKKTLVTQSITNMNEINGYNVRCFINNLVNNDPIITTMSKYLSTK